MPNSIVESQLFLVECELLGNGLLRYTTIVTREIAACVTHFPLSGS